MGQLLQCCPCLSPDDDSIDKQSTVAVHGEAIQLFSAHKKITSKKIDRRTQSQLQRQQSRFFRTNPALQQFMQRQDLSLLNSSRKQQVLLNHSSPSYLSRIKLTIQPQINKMSTTMDEQSSAGQYVAQIEEKIQQPASARISQPSKYEKNPLNLTISRSLPPLLLQNEYRTTKKLVNDRKKSIIQEQLSQPQSKIQQQSIQKQDLYSSYLYISMDKLTEEEYGIAQAHLLKIFQLLKTPDYAQRDSLKPNILAGCCFLLQKKQSQALTYLLKALRMEISQKGTHSIRLIEVYYWLGQTYSSLKRSILSKDYFTKAYRLYKQHQVQEPRLFASICLELGKANHQQEQYAQADRFYEQAIEATEHCEDVDKYLSIMLRSAQNQFQMDNLKATLSRYSRLFKSLKLYHGQKHAFFHQALTSLSQTTQQISTRRLSEEELKEVIETLEYLAPEMEELNILKKLLIHYRRKSKL